MKFAFSDCDKEESWIGCAGKGDGCMGVLIGVWVLVALAKETVALNFI